MQYVMAALAGLGLAELATLITTIYLHRVLSHKAIRLHPVLTMLMRLGTWMLTSISPRSGWRSTASTTTSAMSRGIRTALTSRVLKIMLANVYYYRREANDDDTLEKYASDPSLRPPR